MAASNIRAAAQILPTNINWTCCTGIILNYEHKSADELISSGLVAPEDIPEKRVKRSDDDSLRIHVAKGGYNARILADRVLSRDTGFRRFLGLLLSDCRLSLVQGESA